MGQVGGNPRNDLEHFNSVLMPGPAINPNPLMTEYLVGDAKAFVAAPMTFMDIGARGGINAEWEIYRDQVRVYCFEPDEAECRRLSETASAQVQYIAHALGAQSGSATLYEARLPASSGLYKTRMDYFGRLLNGQNGVTVSERIVQVRTLDEVARDNRIVDLDFIKADAEGAELDILAGAQETLRSAGVLGVLSEVRFQHEINGSPTFSALDAFLAAQGFRLFDLQAYRQSRRVLPYRGLSNYRMPSGERFFAYTQHGQVQDGDALYFRDLLIPSANEFANIASATKLLKLCSLLELYSFSDCAAELILANSDLIRTHVEPEILLDRLSSGMAGRPVTYRDYLIDYFDDRPEIDPVVEPETIEALVEGTPPPPAPTSMPEEKPNLLKRVFGAFGKQ